MEENLSPGGKKNFIKIVVCQERSRDKTQKAQRGK